MSLTHGAYVLDSDPVAWSQEFPMRRSRLYYLNFFIKNVEIKI